SGLTKLFYIFKVLIFEKGAIVWNQIGDCLRENAQYSFGVTLQLTFLVSLYGILFCGAVDGLQFVSKILLIAVDLDSAFFEKLVQGCPEDSAILVEIVKYLFYEAFFYLYLIIISICQQETFVKRNIHIFTKSEHPFVVFLRQFYRKENQ